jgi:hypothetical protein
MSTTVLDLNPPMNGERPVNTSLIKGHPRVTQGTTLLIAAALFAACGGTSSGSPAAAVTQAPASAPAVTQAAASAPVADSVGPDASSAIDTTGTCGVVTAEAVGKAAGFTVAYASGAPGVCIFQSSDRGNDMAVQVYENQAAMATALSVETGSEHIANLGDDAFWVPHLGMLFTRKGDHAVQLTDLDLSTDPTNTATRDALVALARTALPNI